MTPATGGLYILRDLLHLDLGNDLALGDGFAVADEPCAHDTFGVRFTRHGGKRNLGDHAIRSRTAVAIFSRVGRIPYSNVLA